MLSCDTLCPNQDTEEREREGERQRERERERERGGREGGRGGERKGGGETERFSDAYKRNPNVKFNRNKMRQQNVVHRTP